MYDHWQWSRVLRTPSGLLEFRPEVLKELEEKRRSRIDVLAARGRAVGLGQDLALFLFEPLPVCDGTGAELPFLQEILDPSLEERWKTWVEIHPRTAESLGIQDQVIVRVSSPYGSIPAKARVTERVVPGVAAMPIGLGKRAGGRWARGTGSNPLRLLGPLREPLSGLPDPGATRVRIGVETDSAALAGAGEEA
jgi:molybdopterin-containing oxidoreductase family iron-sulfur binding subunit